jgi:hypothetical protein
VAPRAHLQKNTRHSLVLFLQPANGTDASAFLFARALSRQRATRSDEEPGITKRPHRTPNQPKPYQKTKYRRQISKMTITVTG